MWALRRRRLTRRAGYLASQSLSHLSLVQAPRSQRARRPQGRLSGRHGADRGYRPRRASLDADPPLHALRPVAAESHGRRRQCAASAPAGGTAAGYSARPTRPFRRERERPIRCVPRSVDRVGVSSRNWRSLAMVGRSPASFSGERSACRRRDGNPPVVGGLPSFEVDKIAGGRPARSWSYSLPC